MVYRILIIIALLGLVGCAAQKDMIISAEDTGASKPISQMVELSAAPDGTDILYIVDGGSSKKITVDNLLKRLESELSSYSISRPNTADKIVGVIILDNTTAVSVEDNAGDIFFRIPQALDTWNLVDVEACNFTVATGTGSQYTAIQIYNTGPTQGANMLVEDSGYSVLRIDEDELDSKDAAINASYDGSSKIDSGNDDVRAGDQLRFDVDAIPSGAPDGLYIEMHFRKPN